MPREIAMDSSWKEKFAERFWDRLHQLRLRLRPDGTCRRRPDQTAPRVDLPPSENPTDARPKLPRLARPRERTPELVVTDVAGRRRARSTDMETAIPSWRPVARRRTRQAVLPGFVGPRPSQRRTGRAGACTSTRNTRRSSRSWRTWPATTASRESDVASWTQVEHAVWETLGQSLVAKVVHVQSVLRRDVELTHACAREYLSDVALTTAGLGMIWEQQALQPKLGGILGRKTI